MTDEQPLVGDELWNAIESTVKEWRSACDDTEGQELLWFLQGNRLQAFIDGLPTFGCDEHCDDPQHIREKAISSIIINTNVNGADTLEELAYALAGELSETTKKLEKMKQIVLNVEDDL